MDVPHAQREDGHEQGGQCRVAMRMGGSVSWCHRSGELFGIVRSANASIRESSTPRDTPSVNVNVCTERENVFSSTVLEVEN